MFSDSDRLRWLAVITLTGLIAAASAARGADKEPPPPTNRELEQRIKELEDIIKNRPPAAAPAPQPSSPERAELEQIIDDRMKKQKVLAGWQDGFYVNSADGDFKLKLRGLVQLDPRFFPVEDGDTGSDKDFAARLFTQPFLQTDSSPVKNLGFGAAGTFGKRDKESLSSLAFKTAGRSTFFKYDSKVIGRGDQRRFSPQGYYFWGPFSLMGEYIRSDQPSSLTIPPKKTPGKPTVPGMFFQDDVSNRGWLVQTSYVLTGDDAAYDGVQPRNPFDPRAGRWGAVEVAYRYSELNIDPTVYTSGLADRATTAGSATEHTFGVNWYFNKYVKLMLDYEHTGFDRAAPFTNTTFSGKKRTQEDAILSRVQLQF